MLTAGSRATLGLLSPGDRVIERGDRFTTAFGIWGSLTCRAGFVVEDASELPAGIGDYVDRLVGPYFAAVVDWYRALHIGQTGGTLQAIVDEHLGDPFFGIFLNPGHQLHLDEWVTRPSGRARRPSFAPGWRSGRYHPCDRHGLPHDEHRGRHRPGRPVPPKRARGPVSGRLGADRGPTCLHGRRPGHRLHPDVLPFLEHGGHAAAVPVAAGPRHDRGRLGRIQDRWTKS